MRRLKKKRNKKKTLCWPHDLVRSGEMFRRINTTTISDDNFHISSADAYGCKIFANTDTALAKPRYKKQQRQTIYSCTPKNSSTRYEVHVLAVNEVINRRPPSAGDATINIVSRGRSHKPVILVLGSYEPVNWIVKVPVEITISKVILVSTQSKNDIH